MNLEEFYLQVCFKGIKKIFSVILNHLQVLF